MNKNLIPLFLLACILLCCGTKNEQKQSEKDTDKELLALLEKSLHDAVDQYKVLMERLPEDSFPKTYHADRDMLETSGSEWWVSGFYPGTLLYLYEETGDEALLNEAQRIMKVLEKEQYNTSTHDLGFMMYCSFGNAHRLHPSPEYKEILLQSANSLITRFNPAVGAIKSWDSEPENFLVIIDNMMNLELLFWATKVTGDSTYYDIAVKHANTTIENHFREDNSSYHVVNYHPETGAVQRKRTAQGYSDESAWTRGQAWGLYGYVLMYRETSDEKYLGQAEDIAAFMLGHPNMPEDKILYWDFDAPDIPEAFRDASAAAITASALLELSTYADHEKEQGYFEIAETIIQNLSVKPYKAEVGENGGFILKHGVGHLPANSEVDVPLAYGDYYYVEALIRYKNYVKTE